MGEEGCGEFTLILNNEVIYCNKKAGHKKRKHKAEEPSWLNMDSPVKLTWKSNG